MKLDRLFNYYSPQETIGDTNIEISCISTHSALVACNSLFFALKGEFTDGVKYIEESEKNGTVAVVIEEGAVPLNCRCTIVKVGDIKTALSRWSAAFYGFPAESLEMIAVTGTNGKTTIANLIYKILLKKNKAGLIGTSGYFYNEKSGSFGMTTPFAHDLNMILKKMHDDEVCSVVMEVSSHALSLKRVDDIRFDAAIFTNLTQDHLDFHKNFKDYFKSKNKLFSLLKKNIRKAAIINIDDEYSKKIIKGLSFKPVTYGIHNISDYSAQIISVSLNGTEIKLNTPDKTIDMRIKLIGKFNVYNCLASVAWALESGIDMETVISVISDCDSVAGRMEVIKSKNNEKFAVIDYAHTPAALENVLLTLSKITDGNIICVFGCGGDRDRLKRSLMGKIAGTYADRVYITSDNPRSENPKNILIDIEIGIKELQTEYFIIEDRENAIRNAVEAAKENDCILIAGKGDENYQIIGKKSIPFSDREIIKKYI